MVSVLDIRACSIIRANCGRGCNEEGKLEMMTQSEAETQITRILAQLEKDQGAVVESIEVSIVDASSICRTVKRRRAVINMKYQDDVRWDVE
jgi:hypothetical protein